MNEVISRIKTSNSVLKFDADTLTKHTLIIGSTGSGKTTTLNVILRDLIKHKADDKREKIGLLVFDFKEDCTLEKVRQWAKECGRETDVIDFSLGSEYYFNPFDGITNPEQIDETLEKITALTDQHDGNTKYWEFALSRRINTMLKLLCVNNGVKGITFGDFEKVHNLFINNFELKTLSDPISQKISLVKNLLDVKKLSAKEKANAKNFLEMLLQIKNELIEWRNLDERTKSNEISTLSNAFMPLYSSFVRPLLLDGNGKKKLNISDIITKGKIVVVTSAGTRGIGGSSNLAKLIKGEFYTAIQSRNVSYGDGSRLAGIIMDEYPLVATDGKNMASDVFNMQTIRSKNGFVVAATQGLSSIDNTLGVRSRNMLLLNFNSFMIFRSAETQVQEMAETIMRFGKRENTSRTIGFLPGAEGDDANARAEDAQAVDVSVLECGYAYVKFANGALKRAPQKLERLFVNVKPAHRKVIPNVFREYAQMLDEYVADNKEENPDCLKNSLEF